MKKHDVFTVGGSDYFTREPLPIGLKKSITCEVDAGRLHSGRSPQALDRERQVSLAQVVRPQGIPYPTGNGSSSYDRLKEGAYADVLLWDGNPHDRAHPGGGRVEGCTSGRRPESISMIGGEGDHPTSAL